MSLAGLLLALVAAGPGPAQTPSAAGPPPVDEIVVTGSRANAGRKPRPDAVDVLRIHCFDPARLDRRFDPPSSGPRWIELEESERVQFRIEDPDVPAFAMDDESRAQRLWLKFERFDHRSDTREQRCTLLVLGGRNHDRFVDAMSNLFRGPPTQRHVGQPEGSPAIPGWEQWLWTGMPSRGSRSWRRTEPARGSPPSWTVVVDARGFYNSFDYILGEMKSRRAAGPAVTMLTFSFTTRPGRPAARAGARAATPPSADKVRSAR
ncbi:MAG TPA: hypothetical protein VF548_10255 [Allosphingosinicella sp.]|jgi:hypothetical protein